MYSAYQLENYHIIDMKWFMSLQNIHINYHNEKKCQTFVPQVSQRNSCNSSLISGQTDYTVLDQYNSIQLIPTLAKSEEREDIDIKTTFSHPQGLNSSVEDEIHKFLNCKLECREL